MTSRRATKAVACSAAAIAAAVALVACGGGSDASGARQLTFFVAIQPGGTIEKASELPHRRVQEIGLNRFDARRHFEALARTP